MWDWKSDSGGGRTGVALSAALGTRAWKYLEVGLDRDIHDVRKESNSRARRRFDISLDGRFDSVRVEPLTPDSHRKRIRVHVFERALLGRSVNVEGGGAVDAGRTRGTLTHLYMPGIGFDSHGPGAGAVLAGNSPTWAYDPHLVRFGCVCMLFCNHPGLRVR